MFFVFQILIKYLSIVPKKPLKINKVLGNHVFKLIGVINKFSLENVIFIMNYSEGLLYSTVELSFYTRQP